MNTRSISRQTALDFTRAAWQFKRTTLFGIFIPLSSIFLNTLVPLFVGKTLAALSQQNGQTTKYVIYLAITATLGLIANYLGFHAFFKLQPLVMAKLDSTALHTLLNRSAGFHNDRISGKLITDTIAYGSAFQQLSASVVMDIVPFILSMVIGISIVMVNSFVLGILVLAMTVSVVSVAIFQTIRATPLRHERHDARRAMIAHMSDTVINNQTVKTFASESSEIARHEQLGHALLSLRIRDWSRLASDGSKRIAVLLAFEISFILIIIKLVGEDPSLLAIGIFTFSYALNLGNKLFDIGSTFRNVEDAFLEASDTTKLIHETPEIVDVPNAKKLAVTSGEVSFENVGFNYDNASNDKHVFSELSLKINPGEHIGLVGHSGGGKSTFTRLLLRFEDIQSGSIRIDKQNISEVTQKSLRNAISYVPQEPLLFHRTIAQNIAYGTETATQEKIMAAANKAHALDFIRELPQGFDTIVGERGVKLSGGQRQRIVIARAMLKDAPILMLDEATSALDSESEALIQDALWKLMEGRTAIVIAHRLSTIQKMDRIVVLEAGRIIEQGTHAELLKHKGTYASLWAHQSGGFIED